MQLDGNPDHEPPQARVIPLGEPIEGGLALLEGSAAEVRDWLTTATAAQRREVSVWTRGHIWSADEFLAATPTRSP